MQFFDSLVGFVEVGFVLSFVTLAEELFLPFLEAFVVVEFPKKEDFFFAALSFCGIALFPPDEVEDEALALVEDDCFVPGAHKNAAMDRCFL